MVRKELTFPPRMIGGKRYRFCVRRRARRRAKTYAMNAKYLGFVNSYRIFKKDGWWYVFGRGGRKK